MHGERNEMPRRGKKKAKGLKPFLKRSSGAIKPPTDPPPSDGAQPAEDLELRYVHGYRGHDTRNNVHWLNGTEAVFFVAAVGVVHDLQADKQRFFQGHTDDIVSCVPRLRRTLLRQTAPPALLTPTLPLCTQDGAASRPQQGRDGPNGQDAADLRVGHHDDGAPVGDQGVPPARGHLPGV